MTKSFYRYRNYIDNRHLCVSVNIFRDKFSGGGMHAVYNGYFMYSMGRRGCKYMYRHIHNSVRISTPNGGCPDVDGRRFPGKVR